MAPVGDPYQERASLLRALDDALSNAETSASLRGKEAARRAHMWSGIAQAYAAKLFALAQAAPMCQEPHLGLASTRELLTELHARFEVGFDGHPTIIEQESRKLAGDLLEELPGYLLEYRTTNGGN